MPTLRQNRPAVTVMVTVFRRLPDPPTHGRDPPARHAQHAYSRAGQGPANLTSQQGRGYYLDMGRRLHKFTCPGCGKYIERVLDSAQKERCFDCSMTDMVAGIQQMTAKSGPAWDSWLLSRGARGRPPSKQKE